MPTEEENADPDEDDASLREQARSIRSALADEVDAPAEQDDHAAVAREAEDATEE